MHIDEASCIFKMYSNLYIIKFAKIVLNSTCCIFRNANFKYCLFSATMYVVICIPNIQYKQSCYIAAVHSIS